MLVEAFFESGLFLLCPYLRDGFHVVQGRRRHLLLHNWNFLVSCLVQEEELLFPWARNEGVKGIRISSERRYVCLHFYDIDKSGSRVVLLKPHLSGLHAVYLVWISRSKIAE